MRPVWAILGHVGRCWVALGTGLGIHWATWGCHGPSLDTLMQYEGEHRQPYSEICENRNNNNDCRSLEKDIRETWSVGHLGPCWVALGIGLGHLGAVMASLWAHRGSMQVNTNSQLRKCATALATNLVWEVSGGRFGANSLFGRGPGAVWRGGFHPCYYCLIGG